MIKPDYEIIMLDLDIVTASQGCTEQCGVYTCNLQCASYDKDFCVSAGVDSCGKYS